MPPVAFHPTAMVPVVAARTAAPISLLNGRTADGDGLCGIVQRRARFDPVHESGGKLRFLEGEGTAHELWQERGV